MLHWGQGTMFKGLAHLLTALRRHETSSARPQQGRVAGWVR
jgi:hypothetical protein